MENENLGNCPACGRSIPRRSIRESVNYCSRACASQKRYLSRYLESDSSPLIKSNQ